MKSGLQRKIQKAPTIMVNETKKLGKHEIAPCPIHRKLLGRNSPQDGHRPGLGHIPTSVTEKES